VVPPGDYNNTAYLHVEDRNHILHILFHLEFQDGRNNEVIIAHKASGATCGLQQVGTTALLPPGDFHQHYANFHIKNRKHIFNLEFQEAAKLTLYSGICGNCGEVVYLYLVKDLGPKLCYVCK
jgi:hypothetical protein